MKKQFQHIKNFVQDIKDINLTVARERSDVLGVDLQNAEKKLELIKQICASTEKKLSACLQLVPTGSAGSANSNVTSTGGYGTNDATDPMNLSLEKKQRKMPEMQLFQTFQELSDLFDSGEASTLRQTLSESSDLQRAIGRELIHYEQEVEKICIVPLNEILDNDIPNVNKCKKQLTKAIQDMDNYRQKYNQAIKQSNQSNGSNLPNAQLKVETLRKDLEDATVKVEQVKDVFAAELFSFLAREPEFSYIYIQLFKLRANLHRNILNIIETSLPKLENIVSNTAQKPVFGASLEEHCSKRNREVSIVIETCIAWLLPQQNEEGLFRVSGSSSKMKKLKSSFNVGLIELQEYSNDPHTVSGCLKCYLRELPEPLLTYTLYDEWLKAAQISDFEARLQQLWRVCSRLNPIHHNNLRYLVKFLSKLTTSVGQNKMSSQNIAIALAPSLIWAPPQQSSLQTQGADNHEDMAGLNMNAIGHYTIIVEALITYADWFFPDDVHFVTLDDLTDALTGNFNHNNNNNGSNRSNNSFSITGRMSDSYNNTSCNDLNNSTSAKMNTKLSKKPAPPAPGHHLQQQQQSLSSTTTTSNNNNNANITGVLSAHATFSYSPNNVANITISGDTTKYNPESTPTLKSLIRTGSFNQNHSSNTFAASYGSIASSNNNNNHHHHHHQQQQRKDDNNDSNKNQHNDMNSNEMNYQYKDYGDDYGCRRHEYIKTFNMQSDNSTPLNSSSETLDDSGGNHPARSRSSYLSSVDQLKSFEAGSLDRKHLRHNYIQSELNGRKHQSVRHTLSTRPRMQKPPVPPSSSSSSSTFSPLASSIGQNLSSSSSSRERPQSVYIERPPFPPPERPQRTECGHSNENLLNLSDKESNFDKKDTDNSDVSSNYSDHKQSNSVIVVDSIYPDLNRMDLDVNLRKTNGEDEKSRQCDDTLQQLESNVNKQYSFDSLEPPEKPPRHNSRLSNDVNSTGSFGVADQYDFDTKYTNNNHIILDKNSKYSDLMNDITQLEIGAEKSTKSVPPRPSPPLYKCRITNENTHL